MSGGNTKPRQIPRLHWLPVASPPTDRPATWIFYTFKYYGNSTTAIAATLSLPYSWGSSSSPPLPHFVRHVASRFCRCRCGDGFIYCIVYIQYPWLTIWRVYLDRMYRGYLETYLSTHLSYYEPKEHPAKITRSRLNAYSLWRMRRIRNKYAFHIHQIWEPSFFSSFSNVSP